MSQRIALCKTEDVAAGTALKVEAGGLTLAVFNLGGHFFAMDDACSHGPGSLSDGYVDGEEIECDFHNGRFNIKTGEVASPPCMIPQKVYAVTVMDGTVFVEAE